MAWGHMEAELMSKGVAVPKGCGSISELRYLLLQHRKMRQQVLNEGRRADLFIEAPASNPPRPTGNAKEADAEHVASQKAVPAVIAIAAAPVRAPAGWGQGLGGTNFMTAGGSHVVK